MFPSWERLLYFHFLPAVLDGFLALGGVLLLMRIFKVRNPSARAVLLFIPLIRPLIIFLEGGAKIEPISFPNIRLAVRLPDPFDLIPLQIADQPNMSTASRLIGILIITAIIAAALFLTFRWIGFLAFYRRLRRISSHADESTDGKLIGLVGELSREMDLKNPPEILMTDGHWATPCAIGYRHPALVLDRDFPGSYSRGEMRAILAHELGHIVRRDCLWHWASVLLRDLVSFSPFSHISVARIGLEREKACDRLAVETAGISPRLMAQCLVKSLKMSAEENLEPLPGYGLSFSKKNQNFMRKRLEFLLSMPDKGGGTGGSTRTTMGVARKALLLLVCIPLTLIQLYIGVWIGGFPLVLK